MPPTPAELEAYRRIAREEAVRAAREEAERRLAPVAKRLEKHSGEMNAVRDDNRVIREEYGPAVLRMVHESNHDQDVATASLAKITEQAIIAIREEQSRQAAVQAEHTTILKSIPPAALGAERAAHRTEGKTDAIQVAADRADSQSGAAVKWAKLSPVLTVVAQAITLGFVLGLVKACQAIAAAGGSP